MSEENVAEFDPLDTSVLELLEVLERGAILVIARGGRKEWELLTCDLSRAVSVEGSHLFGMAIGARVEGRTLLDALMTLRDMQRVGRVSSADGNTVMAGMPEPTVPRGDGGPNCTHHDTVSAMMGVKDGHNVETEWCSACSSERVTLFDFERVGVMDFKRKDVGPSEWVRPSPADTGVPLSTLTGTSAIVPLGWWACPSCGVVAKAQKHYPDKGQCTQCGTLSVRDQTRTDVARWTRAW